MGNAFRVWTRYKVYLPAITYSTVLLAALVCPEDGFWHNTRFFLAFGSPLSAPLQRSTFCGFRPALVSVSRAPLSSLPCKLGTTTPSTGVCVGAGGRVGTAVLVGA